MHNKELDRLKVALDYAFEHKQELENLLQSAKESLQFVRTECGAELDSLKAEIEELNWQKHNLEQRFFGLKSRDFPTAVAFQRETKRLIELSVALSRQMIPLKRAISNASAMYRQAMQDYQEARQRYYDAEDDFNQALERLYPAKGFNEAEQKRLVHLAGVPYQYADDVAIVVKEDGIINLYFGGEGRPDGPGHGHYAIDSKGNATYRRNPNEARGRHNFRSETEYIRMRMRHGYEGGFGLTSYGYVDNQPVTFALGWGAKAGEMLLAYGHLSEEDFRRSPRYYAKGQGPHIDKKTYEKIGA